MGANIMTNELKNRYVKFWERAENSCIMHITSSAPSGAAEYVDPVKKWTDVDYRMSEMRDVIPRISLHGDAVYSIFTNFGPGALAACIGGNFVPADDTVWFDRNPIISDWRNLPNIELDKNSEMWRLIDNFTQTAAKSSNGEYYTSITDLGGIIDIIASLRGTQELLYDLYDYPEEILALGEKIRRIWKEAYTYLANTVLKYQDGFTSWMPIWCEERYYPLQCDFSAMMSPDMFEKFVLPELKDLSEFLDRSVYHLDGPGEIPHLDHLLALPRLSAIQWVPDPMLKVSDEEWFAMYEKIIAAGKGLVLFMRGCDKAEDIENLLKRIPKKGLYIMWEAKNAEQARDLIELARLN